MAKFNVAKNFQREMAQSFSEGKKMARSLENIATSFRPLTTDEETTKILDEIIMYSQLTAAHLTTLYNQVAPDAFKE